MDISLTDSLKDFVDEQVRRRGYGTRSECVRELIRRDIDEAIAYYIVGSAETATR